MESPLKWKKCQKCNAAHSGVGDLCINCQPVWLLKNHEGEFSFNDLASLVQCKKLFPYDLIQGKGNKEWVVASSVSGLFKFELEPKIDSNAAPQSINSKAITSQDPPKNDQPNQNKKDDDHLMKFVYLIIFVVVALVIAKQVSKNSNSIQSPRPTEFVSANAMYRDFLDNKVNAEFKYDGKDITVTGQITQIGSSAFGTPFVVLGGNSGIGGIQCYFNLKEKHQIATLRNGEFIDVRGVYYGTDINVLMDGCVIERR